MRVSAVFKNDFCAIGVHKPRGVMFLRALRDSADSVSATFVMRPMSLSLGSFSALTVKPVDSHPRRSKECRVALGLGHRPHPPPIAAQPSPQPPWQFGRHGKYGRGQPPARQKHQYMPGDTGQSLAQSQLRHGRLISEKPRRRRLLCRKPASPKTHRQSYLIHKPHRPARPTYSKDPTFGQYHARKRI